MIQNLVKWMITMFVICVIPQANAQRSIDSLIQIGLENNLVLKQKNIGLNQARAALRTARTYFYPTADFNSSYISGQGGRYFEFPVGDLVNPVYTTLNQLTGTESFPQIENEEAYLNPYNFYDVHTRINIPIYRTDLGMQKNISSKKLTIAEHELEVYILDLKRDIKIAVYKYLSAENGVKIYESAEKIVLENLKTINNLIKAGKAIPVQRMRIEVELETIKAKIIDAINQKTNALNYLNFLLNRELNTEVFIGINLLQAVENSDITPENLPNLRRHEISILNEVSDIQELQYQNSRRQYIPKIGAFLDLGSQASNFVIDNKSIYYLAGVQLDLPLFNWNRNKLLSKQFGYSLALSKLQEDQIKHTFLLTSEMAKRALISAKASLLNSKKGLEAAEAYYKVMESGFNLGTNTLLELIDAREMLTRSQIQFQLDQYLVLEKYVHYQREIQSI